YRLGLSPSPAIRIPALISSSLNFPISSSIASCSFDQSRGSPSFSESSFAFTITMTRMTPPIGLGGLERADDLVVVEGDAGGGGLGADPLERLGRGPLGKEALPGAEEDGVDGER